MGGLSVCYTQKFAKIAMIYVTVGHFDHEDPTKTIFFVKDCEKSMDKAFYDFWKLKNIFIINRDIYAQTSAKIIKIIKSYFTEKAFTWSNFNFV